MTSPLEPQWLPEHKRDAKAIVLGRRQLGVVEPVVVSSAAALDLDDGDGVLQEALARRPR